MKFCGKCSAGYVYKDGDNFNGHRCVCNPVLTVDEFAYLAHQESCPDCLGHEDGVEVQRARIDVKDLERRLAAAKAANPTRRYFTMEQL